MRVILVFAIVVMAGVGATLLYRASIPARAAPPVSAQPMAPPAPTEPPPLPPLSESGQRASTRADDQGDVKPIAPDAGEGSRLPEDTALFEFVTALKPSVVTVIASDGAGVETASGSGFLLAENLIVANRQVAQRGETARVLLAGGETIPVEAVVAEHEKANLVLLSIAPGPHLDRAKLRPLPLSATIPEAGDEVLVIAAAVGREHTVALGTVKGGENIGEIGEALAVDVAFEPGSTASPVIDASGEVVGVAALRHEDGSPRKFVLSAASLLSLRVSMEAATPTPLAEYHAAWAASPEGASATVSAEPLRLEATIVKQGDGSILIDDQFVVRGEGTQENPYVISWDLLVSAVKVYKPREGKNDLPQRITMLHDKWVKLTGYVAFPLMSQTTDELLLMLNQWDGCCIGVPPTPYDAVEVRLVAPMDGQSGVNIFNYGSITGVLKVDPYVVSNWLVGLYMMEQAKLELEM